jgi:hypothetical protein
VRRRFLPPLVFQTWDQQGEYNWLIDPKSSEVRAAQSAPAGCAIIRVHARILQDCVQHRMFSVWGPSKRLKVILPAARFLSAASLWFTVLDLYELEVFPLRNNFSLRSLGIRLRRWREAVEVARILLRRFVLGRRFDVADCYRERSTAAVRQT